MFNHHFSSTAGRNTQFQTGLGMLTRRVYFHMVRSASRLLAPFDVTVEQYVVLLCLDEEERLTQQELVRRCSSDPRTMGKMIDLLSAKDWLRRVAHAHDRRAWQIVLSAEGRKRKRKMDAALVPLRERPAKVLGTDESKLLRETLARLAEALDPEIWLQPGGTSPPNERRHRSTKPTRH
jgi:DNA-binding MarR family transcriptional regulator